jgi:hypothetical protein
VERAVQTFKQAMKKQKGSLQTRLSRFLFKYRITPHTTTGQAPVQLRWGTQLRPIYTVRLVVYDSYSGVCDRINTRTNVTFQISPSANEQ